MQLPIFPHGRLIGAAAIACAAALIPAASFAATASAAGARATVGSPASGPTRAHPVTAYVANGGSDTVTPIRTATNTAAQGHQGRERPRAIAITPDGKTAYVANAGLGTR